MGLNVLQQLQSSRAYKNVFPSLSMKCASCCCPNNVVDCIAFHCIACKGGAPFVHVVFLHSSLFAQTIRHYMACKLCPTQPPYLPN
jgi:hypothetical protein